MVSTRQDARPPLKRGRRKAPDGQDAARTVATPAAVASDTGEASLPRKQLLAALSAFRRGDFSVRLPADFTGIDGRIAEALNDIIELNDRMSAELARISQVVGKQGRISQRASLGEARGGWAAAVSSVNALITDLVQPTSDMARVIGGVAKGDLSQAMALDIDGRPLEGEFLRAAKTVNLMVDQLGSFASEVTRVAREVGTEGKLGGQARVKGVAGTWKDLTDSVNSMAGNLTAQVRNIAAVTTAVANGDLSKKITVDVKGEILELKDTINTMVDQRPFTPEVLRTKVGVFVELYRKNRQVRRQAQTLQQRAAQLHKLAAASIAINSTLGVEEILRAVCEHAREIVGAHQAVVSTTLGPASSRARHVSSVSARDADAPRRRLDPDPPELAAMVRRAGHALRLSEAELRAGVPSATDEASALRGWLAAPLTGRDGTHLGLIQLSDRYEGDFTQDDESILVQLAQMAGIAIENALFAREREANRAKDEFLATVSHELRTPLNAILGWSQLLAEREVPADRLTHGLRVIERNARAQATLVDDLLEAARMASGKLRVQRQQVSLREILDSVIEGFRPQAAAKSVSLEVELEADEPYPLFGDPDRLAQVVRNLLSNAVKFTPERGHVRVASRRHGGRVRVVVSDDGCGIESQFLPHVFDRFRQADSTSARRYGGLGIGLTIVRHIVEAHGGTVGVLSAGVGLGATFTVELPLLEVRASVLGAGAEPPTPALHGVRVLFVDDEDDTRELVARMLETQGAEVQAVASASAALEAFDREVPDVLVTDLALPGEDGYALVRRLRQRTRAGATLPVVALTAYTREEDRARTLACGFDVHVNKPVDAGEIVSAVAGLVGPRPQAALAAEGLRAVRP